MERKANQRIKWNKLINKNKQLIKNIKSNYKILNLCMHKKFTFSKRKIKTKKIDFLLYFYYPFIILFTKQIIKI